MKHFRLVVAVIMVLETEHLARLAIGERRFVANHRPGHWLARAYRQRPRGRKIASDGVVDSVEDMEVPGTEIRVTQFTDGRA